MRTEISYLKIDLAVQNREDLFRHIAGELHRLGKIPEIDDPVRQLLEREEVGSTAVGAGIAFPHARSPVCTEHVLAAVRLEPAIPFDAPDGSAVDLVFLILGPDDSPGDHVQLLARIARAVSRPELAQALRAAADEKTFGDALEEGMPG